MPRVFIPNKGFHDFSAAERFGELIYLTEDAIPTGLSVNQIYRLITNKMAESSSDDMLLICSLSILNAAAASVLARKHGCVNYLIYQASTDTYRRERVSLRDLPSE